MMAMKKQSTDNNNVVVTLSALDQNPTNGSFVDKSNRYGGKLTAGGENSFKMGGD